KGPSPDWVNEWTEEMTPLRVRNVPKIVSEKVSSTRTMFHTRSMSFFSWIITEWRYAVETSHGMKAAFSTGSHAQYPPQPSTSYAHRAPNRLPSVRKNHEKIAHRRVVRIHESSRRPVIIAAAAKPNGTVVLT